MKKVVLVFFMFFTTLTLMTSCGEKNSTENATSNTTENATPDTTEQVVASDTLSK
jgi:hypothetical protein